jgi:hypothetical protein
LGLEIWDLDLGSYIQCEKDSLQKFSGTGSDLSDTGFCLLIKIEFNLFKASSL